MEFLIMSEREIKTYLSYKEHIIISIRSPEHSISLGTIPPNSNCIDILWLAFHDLDGTHNPSITKYTLFSKEDAQNILRFVRRYIALDVGLELIICQCYAGISRSAGVAAALSKILNGDDTEIFKHYLPNMLVYRTILNEARKK